MRTKPSKRTESQSTTVASGEVNSQASPTVESYLGLTRVSADENCVVCANDVDYLYVLQKCGHQACLECWCTFVSSQVSSFAMAHITCIACNQRLSHPLTLQLLKHRQPPQSDSLMTPVLTEQQMSAEKLCQRYEEFLLYQCLLRYKHTRWCPCGCGYAVLASNGFRICPRIECQHPNCSGGAFCYKCRGPWNTDGSNHVCRQSNTTAVGGGGGGGGIEGSNTSFDNHRSLLSRLQQFLRLPAAAATSTNSVVATVGVTRQKVGAELHGDVEIGLEGRARQPSERLFHTPTVPVQAADATGTSTEDEAEDNVTVDRVPDAGISNVDLVDLPGDLSGQVKACPRCKTLLLKIDDGSCNHMSCFICGCEFCWLCLREVRDTHFLSPTGCTFWGRSRWPIRRRICAMLMAAFGTPFILAIVTALAVPGIVIGIPSYLVYKVGQQTKGSKAKRVLLKILSFFGGLIVSPIIAALIALFGIPLVLIYVYIFMPITLFSELKLRFSAKSTDPMPVDPDLGFKINWDHVGESGITAPSSSSALNDSPKLTKASQLTDIQPTASPDILHE